MHLKVASYNVRKAVGTDWKRRPDRVLDVLSEIKADIVALQEIDRRFGSRRAALSPELIEAESPYRVLPLSARPQSIGWHGNALLVRKHIDCLQTRRLALPALEPRGAALADLFVGGKTLRIVGMHLGLVGHWRKRQAEAVIETIEGLETFPTVLMGDLNEWRRHKGTLAAFQHRHHVTTPGPTFHAHFPLAAFDRIITTPDIAIMRCGVHLSELARVTSDHLPIWADIHVGG